VAATFFRLIQIILLPIAVVCYVPFVLKLVAYSRRTGVSATVLASLYTFGWETAETHVLAGFATAIVPPKRG
jgi:hypothetical protein